MAIDRSFARGLMFSAWIFASWIFASNVAGAEALKSQYSSLQNCETLERLKLPGRTLEKGAGTGVFHCKGIDNYSVYVIEDDPRSFLVLGRGGKLFSLEKPLVSDFKLGEFANVSGAQQAEWRLDANGKAGGIDRARLLSAHG